MRRTPRYQEYWCRQKPLAPIREGGSLPILPMFKKLLGAESIMMGFCLANCNAHGPNEWFVIDDFIKGTKAAAYLPHMMAS